MRHEAVVVEGEEEKSVLIPLPTMLAIPAQFDGKGWNDLVGSDVDPFTWEPWVVWHAMTKRAGESRSFSVWCESVDWSEIRVQRDAAVPSGDQENLTGAPSQSSSPAAPAPGPSSSSSTTTSSTPSGLSSTAA